MRALCVMGCSQFRRECSITQLLVARHRSVKSSLHNSVACPRPRKSSSAKSSTRCSRKRHAKPTTSTTSDKARDAGLVRYGCGLIVPDTFSWHIENRSANTTCKAPCRPVASTTVGAGGRPTQCRFQLGIGSRCLPHHDQSGRHRLCLRRVNRMARHRSWRHAGYRHGGDACPRSGRRAC